MKYQYGVLLCLWAWAVPGATQAQPEARSGYADSLAHVWQSITEDLPLTTNQVVWVMPTNTMEAKTYFAKDQAQSTAFQALEGIIVELCKKGDVY